MHADTPSQLPGIVPLGTVTLTVYITPDGSISHYEVQGRAPDGSLTAFRAQACLLPFEYDSGWVETLDYLAWRVRDALRDPTALDRIESGPPPARTGEGEL